ncbi:short-chain dehydrogenase [Mycobacterium paraffinicum]|uniref:Short-chain dehydrogenase n=1 Tax=Mycobacterium paraffinicum TaxID=53378 RepID=A0A1Q4HN78_9MYCO|nr:coniferyl-alcohol dehydrogenase [Mycobacterium paraffinicum]OJZ68980.1 short-chain dehydrogenase [Mycobacterium paraffinicum]
MNAQRRTIVVGAGSGIGAATAAHFHAAGDHVLAVDRDNRDVTASEYAELDLRDSSSIADLAARLDQGWDVLAHVAGVPGTLPAQDVLTINYLGFRLMAEGLLPLMRRGGSIVAVASTAGAAWAQRTSELSGLLQCTTSLEIADWYSDQDHGYPAYNTSKEALILFAKSFASRAWAQHGVRVNTVSPGPVETPILHDFEVSMGKEILDMARSAVGRHATVDDIAPVISFLASPASSWVVGQDIQVDGGFANSIMTPAAIA